MWNLVYFQLGVFLNVTWHAFFIESAFVYPFLIGFPGAVFGIPVDFSQSTYSLHPEVFVDICCIDIKERQGHENSKCKLQRQVITVSAES